ncbi:MAG: glycosyl hydrolase family 18 protein [Bacteroidaceae bacterium]|nr:glycosyl hydrolase family 18 protein [Bacteroidaceae bacterium]
MMKTLHLRTVLLLCLLMTASASMAGRIEKDKEKVVVAYVTSWTEVIPDPHSMTHINYAFALVNDSFDGIRISNPERLHRIAALKKDAPHLRVMLSVGGWGAGNFSEMAASPKLRKAFAKDCLKAVEEFGLDGIDIDWEYPTQNSAGISCSPDDTKNFTLLMRDLRKALGSKRLLTIATVASGEYIDFPSCIKYLDFVNVMAYDMGNPPVHHAPLYSSPVTGWMSTSKAIESHLQKGIPARKLVMGMPFYGRGPKKYDYYHSPQQKLPPGISERWSEKAQVPYLANQGDTLVYGYDNIRSLAIKCQYVMDHGLLGGMYWEYADDTPQGDKRRTLQLSLMQHKRGTEAPQRILAIAETGNEHEAFSRAALAWLQARKDSLNIQVDHVTSLRDMPAGSLQQYHLILQLDYPPYAWSDEAKADFIQYIEHGTGAYIGFHHASLLGDIFGAGPMWDWFSKFMGGIRWKGYIEKPTDGTICLEDRTHPVTANLPDTIRIPQDEWYTYHSSPRPNVHVLAHVDEHSYSPASSVRMGDHPVIWTNPSIPARNVYFQFGHSASLFQQPAFVQMFSNAIRWALGK